MRLSSAQFGLVMIDEQMLGVNKEKNENMGYVDGVIVRGVRCGLGGEVPKQT